MEPINNLCQNFLGSLLMLLAKYAIGFAVVIGAIAFAVGYFIGH